MRISLHTLTILCLAVASQLHAEDWPMWRYDSARSAESTESLPTDLKLLWSREFPRLKPAYRTKRLQFDASYEPIVLRDTIIVGSSYNDSLTAFDTETGRERWRFYAGGPIRFAPVAWRGSTAAEDRVVVGSDDGCVYCLAASDGKVVWKRRAVPSERKVLGNGRLISLWPIRGGIVLHDDKLYFAAGVWSFEGVFVYCVDATTGETIWRNDESGNVYGMHPHGAEAFGGVTPQGYLVVNGEDLIVPCGQAYPATFDLKTGELKEFELPAPGRLPGSYFASADVRRGIVKLDKELNSDLHEDKTYIGRGVPGRQSTITVSGNELSFANDFDVEGQVSSLVVADGKLFVVTIEGKLQCFGEKPPTDAKIHGLGEAVSEELSQPSDRIKQIVDLAKNNHGYAVIRGARSFDWLMQLVERTTMQFIVVESDADRANSWRRLLAERGLYGQRVSILVDDPIELSLPPLLASMEIVDSTEQVKAFVQHADKLADRFNSLRPYGGVAILACSKETHDQLAPSLKTESEEGLTIERIGSWTLVRREGGLPGAVNYMGGWASPDEFVRAPLGVLWFDDALGHFKRSPQPWFVDGVMISLPKDWMEKHRAGRKPPYDLLPPVVSDVYTGRVIKPGEALLSRIKLPQRDASGPQPNQYRPPTQLDAWKPKQPIVGERINPLTGEAEPRAIPKSYGCDGGVDYGNFYTMRSGTPAFYDKRLESGVCNISGPRSGCTNSIIPACGVLNVPYFYEGCTCSYPLPAGLAMVNMPETHEQWSSWGPGKAENIVRVGINFGAPGDRMTSDGTLWLEYPPVGGASPAVDITVEPSSANYFYRHSVWVKGGEVWPWVAASGVEGASAITIRGMKPGKFTVRLTFAEHSNAKAPREFDVALNDTSVAEGLSVREATNGSMRSTMRQYRDVDVDAELRVGLTARAGRTVLSGVELIRQ